jgi:hypothetical protein
VTFVGAEVEPRVRSCARTEQVLTRDTHGNLQMRVSKTGGGSWLEVLRCFDARRERLHVLLEARAQTGRFCTARAPGDAIRFLAIGDTNPSLGDNTTKVLLHTLPKNPDFVVHGGDIQYYSV